jgi:hypothetical protein
LIVYGKWWLRCGWDDAAEDEEKGRNSWLLKRSEGNRRRGRGERALMKNGSNGAGG